MFANCALVLTSVMLGNYVTVPEPGTWLLIGTGMLLLLGYVRRRSIKN